MRYAACIAYDGFAYSGWQAQVGRCTVEGCVNYAISKIANHDIDVICAGRTDAGVHATQQIIHFDSESNRSLDQWLLGINSELPEAIRLQWIKEVDDDFHARFSAVSRHYCYVIYQHKIKPCLLSHNITWQYSPLDITAMHKAAQYLMGKHDFTSFRSSQCQAHTAMRTMELIKVYQQRDFIVLEVKGNAFLHHMVRNIVGVLFEVGEGKKPAAWVKEVLDAKDRRKASITAPAAGLYLCKVQYPEKFDINSKLTYPFFL